MISNTSLAAFSAAIAPAPAALPRPAPEPAARPRPLRAPAAGAVPPPAPLPRGSLVNLSI